MSVNINRQIDDMFYRYKMPKLTSRVTGSGNGIKTLLTNVVEVARALERPPAYITKFFGGELGAQTSIDEKTARYIVNGAHQTSKLADILDIFIKRFVLCPSCSNPETAVTITRKGEIFLACKACGSRNMIDMTHRLVPYILRNPPDGASDDTLTSSSAGKEKKRSSKSKGETEEERQAQRQARRDAARALRAGAADAKASEDAEDTKDDLETTAGSPALINT
ncbi:translation initiation factor 5 [Fonticula alba]|uniref:Translation initiation factor 5 n=1 Tax=Fonticula alba TaxID=691883 RepID=A0A058ZB86_FONAL|nr:translation initiation factor 5 [Fonticula alba]KCV71183.1 translation initiation factor 5 [Fonticula alba]|eukprot:XP_009494306.1 translation initiation factor 5 [Fonticula alba]